MFFKRLELQGFKSFVDKTVLEFGSGITAIVGPNGSGKSNISDAIRWVLGEQSPKTLRGGRMEDIIFAGTENRRPVGFAEVSIVMDNADGAFNVDYEEVKVTRRLFRSGDSEYLINGSQCRLKDIYMLFADTGIGKEGYSIIGQGKVDEILSSKSDERRGIFEEASGIMKYRMRKQESERKLASTEQNLLRINDIISELELQVTALTRQAATAKQYLTLKYELRDIEVGVLVDTVMKATDKLAEIKKNSDIIQKQIEDDSAALEKIKSDNQSQTEYSHVLDEKRTAVQQKIIELEKTIERINASIAVNNQKIAAIEENCKRLEGEIKLKEGKHLEQKNIIAQIDEQSDEAEKLRVSVQEDIVVAEEKFNKIIALLSTDSAAAGNLRDSIMEKKLAFTQRQSAVTALTSQNESLNQRLNILTDELENCIKNNQETLAEADKASSAYKECNDELSAEGTILADAVENVLRIQAANESNVSKISSVRSSIQANEARLNLLKEMEESFEGYAKSVKEILTLCRENKSFGKGIYGAVAQILNVPADYELAIETALGNTYQDIVTESEDDAKQAIDYLKKNKLGRATFLPLTAVNRKQFERETITKLQLTDGYIGVAAELVECEPKFENIAFSLLGKIAVFENIDTAIEASKRFKYSFMCVTLDGDVIRTSGAITGGSSEKIKRSGTLTRTREIPVLQAKIVDLRKDVEKLSKLIENGKTELSAAEAARSAAFEKVHKLEITASELKSAMERAAERKASVEARIAQLQGDADRCQSEISANNAAITSFNEECETLKAEVAVAENNLADYEEKAKTGIQIRDTMQNEITTLKLRLSDLNNKIERYADDKKRILEDIEKENELSDFMQVQLDESASNVEEIKRENAEYNEKADVAKADKKVSDEEYAKLTAEKKAVDDSLSGMITQITDISGAIGVLREEMGRLDIRRTRAEHESESGKNRLWEEYELTYTKALELTGGKTPENLEECRKRISELRGGIKRLGNVNVDAIEELESTTERCTFLTEQRKDMEETRGKLLKVIAELTKVMQDQFKEQFELIRENFKIVFSELFGGGKADITLADEGDVLESGIEIVAQPPGKKLQNMMLLSGGERALTAIALLFGILRMRPTPFCMLDEIESALDDANVYRFANYTKAVSESTQLILISHRKGTMESADALYGVTMEEKGVSRVVALKVSEDKK